MKNSFAVGVNIENEYGIDLEKGVINVHSKEGKSLFYLKNIGASTLFTNSVLSILLRLIAVFCVLIFINSIAKSFYSKYNFIVALVFLVGTIGLLRFLSYKFPIPFNLRQFELFDPTIYSSSAILKSLGDLLINTFLFIWISFFVRRYSQEYASKIKLNTQTQKWLLLGGCSVAFIFLTFNCANVIRSMISDSQVSFDIVNFFTLTKYSAIGFVIICSLTMAYFMLSQSIVQLLKKISPEPNLSFYLLISIFGLLYLSFKLIYSTSFFELIVLVWLLLYAFLLTKDTVLQKANKFYAVKLVRWLFLFSCSITVLIVLENTTKEIEKRKHYAETLASKTDPASTSLMSIMLTDFRNDFLSKNFERFKIEKENKFLKDSLLNGNFASYTNKYDTKLFLFDKDEKPLFNTDTININELNVVLTTDAKPTSIPDLYYYDIAYDQYSYIGKKNIIDTGNNLLGYFYILANPKKNKSEALYPELFSKGKINGIENSSLYSFAVYNNFQLISNHNDYSFATKLAETDLPKEEFTLISKNGFDELWYKFSTKKIVIIARHNNFIIEGITLFSYLFCIFLILSALFWLFNNLLHFEWSKLLKLHYLQFTIRSQIFGTIIFISVISFLIIGVATILFFIKRYEDNNKERLSRTIKVMGNEAKTSLNELAIFDDVIKIYDEAYIKKLEQTIEKISSIHAADINLYDLEGNLKVSSLPIPYTKGILSTKMNPIAFYHLSNQKEIQHFGKENIGNLNFVSNYVPILDDSGNPYAFLNIPYFTSQSELKKEISNFLVTIINLNAFIFLIAGIVALFITNRITRSFSFISDKMKLVNLGKVNAEINWNRNDEIGELVNEYNKMVGKLDFSAAALAKSEREGAWREMARQVAHEIKNPLTPMKLSLQYLQKAIAEKSNNVHELTASVANTLVEQINHLNQIAGEFSQFANIGNPKKEVFELNDELKLVLQLHSMADNVTIFFNPIQVSCKIEADKTQINRLFNNLILNAIQAQQQKSNSTIRIDEEINATTILVKIKDNGTGIPYEKQSKIFTPNFTTKTSGTGLGLAMCKGIVEQNNGKIWFETKENIGTIFFVELPLQ